MPVQDTRISDAHMREIVEWDVATWRKAILYWQRTLDARMPDGHGKTLLEIGARHGGVSLFFAQRGFTCLCTDKIEETGFAQAKALHEKHGVSNQITYALADCTCLPYADDSFDVVVFKSVLGHVGRDGQEQRIPLALAEMRRVLKPGGLLLFAENLEASSLHRLLRRAYVRWGKQWNYLSLDRLEKYLDVFHDVQVYTYGFFGCMAKDRWFSDLADRLVCLRKRSVNHYMCYGMAQK